MTDQDSSVPEEQKPAAWVRITGVLLVIAGFVLNIDSLAWLFADDKSIDSERAALLISVVQVLLVVVGGALTMRPQLLAGLAALKNLLLGLAGFMAAAGIVGMLGAVFVPPVDFRYATYPDYSCSLSNPFCNTTAAARLMDVKRYGKGAAFADIDGDGWIDLYAADAEPRLHDDWGVSSFYLNNGDGTFRPVDIGLEDQDLHTSWSGIFADFDNDGDQDLLHASGGYAGVGRLSLYENRMDTEGKFVAITEAAGLEVENDRPYRWWGSSWADYDGDGYLDFAVSRVEKPALVFHNNGDGTFSNVTDSLGVKTTGGEQRDGKNVIWFDYDNDGDPDLYLAGIQEHNLYENLEGKYFLDVTDKVFAGLMPDNWLYQPGEPVVFVAGVLDFNQDGAEDLYLGRQAEQDLLLLNNGKGEFTAMGWDFGIDASHTAKNQLDKPFENTMGLGIGDLQDDGWPDIIIGTGDPVRAAEDIVYCNDRGKKVHRCLEDLRGNAKGPHRARSHGLVFGDVNHDGLTDLYQNLGGHAPWDVNSGIDSREFGALYMRNPGSDVKTVMLLLEGTVSNRDAIGARIVVTGDEKHYYTVRSSNAFVSQNDKGQLVTLGNADSGEVVITWPSGTTSSHAVTVGERIVIKEPD